MLKLSLFTISTILAATSLASAGDDLSAPPASPYNDVPLEQGAPMLNQGDHEFTIAGQLDFDGFRDLDYTLRLGYGWFITDGWEFGITGSAADQNDSREYSGGFFTEYNFVGESKKWVPFVGVSTEWAGLDASIDDLNIGNDAILLGGQIGLKYFFRPNIAISTALTYSWATDDIFDSVDSFEDSTSTILIGLRYYF